MTDDGDDVSIDEAAVELKRRRELRHELEPWCRHNGFIPAAHHRLILSKLKQVSEGKLDRLAIFMPPGSAKSTYASVLFPPWYLAQHPDHLVIAASHTVELAEKWGRRVREAIIEHSQLLGFGINARNQAAGRWETTAGGEYFAVGVGGSIAGWRGDLVLIDDPVRSREDTESATIRDKKLDWYRSDIIPRLKPGGRIVLIQTRWHEEDLAGRILAEAEAGNDQWEISRCPPSPRHDDPLGRAARRGAVAAMGGPGATGEKAPLDRRARLDRAVPATARARGGRLLQGRWLKPIDTLPDRETLRIYGGSDYAVTRRRRLHRPSGRRPRPASRMYLLEVWRERASCDAGSRASATWSCKWKPIGWAEEKGQIAAGIGPYLDDGSASARPTSVARAFPPAATRASARSSIRGSMAQEGLYICERSPWFPRCKQRAAVVSHRRARRPGRCARPRRPIARLHADRHKEAVSEDARR